MSHAEQLMNHPPAMAELVGAVLEDDAAAVPPGIDVGAVVAAEMAGEGSLSPRAAEAPDEFPVGLARMAAETEE